MPFLVFRTIITSMRNCQIRRQTNGGSPSSSPIEKLLAVLTDGWTGDTEEHENSTIQSHDVLIGKPAQIAADPRLSNRRDFVRHQAAGRAQSVSLARLDRQTEQRGVRGIGGERANRDRICHIEAVVLQDHGGTRLAGIASGTGKGPYHPALQIPYLSVTVTGTGTVGHR